MGLADLHIHTSYSWDGTGTVRAVLRHARLHTPLDVIAITDHDEIAGALEAVRLAPEYDLQVIPGCEVSTKEGHLLALFIEQPIPAGRPLVETIRRVGDLGGRCIIPHPLAGAVASGLTAAAIHHAINAPGIEGILVGIETYSAGMVHRANNRRAAALAQTLPLAQVGNSDAHMLFMIGLGATAYEGASIADLQQALANRATRAVQARPISGAEIVGNWLPRILLRRAGWIATNEGPKHPIRFIRSRQAAGRHATGPAAGK